MVDQEVENILSQIRERVRAQPLPSASAVSRQENGAGDSPVSTEASRESREALSQDARERIESYLTTTARAWNRLPPLMSNRSGSTARFELWVKSLIKRATNWFTWEQVNFNAAAHHAIRDTLETLAAVEQELGKLRAETNSQRATLQQGQAETETLRKENATLRAEIQTQLQTQRAEIETQRVDVEKYRLAREAERPLEAESFRKEFHARLVELSQEMQQRLAQLTDEQRVCFKQLSLEATEASVLEDRARRKTEAMLEELRGRLDRIQPVTSKK